MHMSRVCMFLSMHIGPDCYHGFDDSTFTLDTTASVNLITEEVAKDLRQPANKKASRSKGFQSARVEEDETDMLLQNDDEVGVAAAGQGWCQSSGESCCGRSVM